MFLRILDYGGMENPCLSFYSPGLLAGNRSLTSVVAHEVAHSWTGNLVGCTSWEHFWLNEGFTRFLEAKILEKMFGKPMADFEAIEGITRLRDSIKAFEDRPELTALVPDLTRIDPDDSFNRVPYEKGRNLLKFIEQKLTVGRSPKNIYSRICICVSILNDGRAFYLQI